ncbi:MAG: HPr family phosphocarrier protein [Oscillospiraceae bacterium]|nr:HPr family phosphocarrier protein [Oscillospiraceae bacterium]
MVTKDFELPFATDTHIGFVSGFVLEAGRFKSKIEICFGDKCMDAKSFLGLIYASSFPCTRFTLRAEGEDEQQALAQLSAYMDKYR